MANLYYNAMFKDFSVEKAYAVEKNTNASLKPFLEYLNIAIREQKKRKKVAVKWEKVDDNYISIEPCFTVIDIETHGTLRINISNWVKVTGSVKNADLPMFDTETYKVLKYYLVDDYYIVHLDREIIDSTTVNWGPSEVEISPLEEIFSIIQVHNHIEISDIKYSSKDNSYEVTFVGKVDQRRPLILNDVFEVYDFSVSNMILTSVQLNNKSIQLQHLEHNAYCVDRLISEQDILITENERIAFNKVKISLPLTYIMGDNEINVSKEKKYFRNESNYKIDAEMVLVDEKGLKYNVSPHNVSEKNSIWIQLADDEKLDREDGTSDLDYYFEDSCTKIAGKLDGKEEVYSVLTKDRDKLQLLITNDAGRKNINYDMLPIMFNIVANTYNLERQRDAIYELINRPLYEHFGLVSLAQGESHYVWDNIVPKKINDWFVLTKGEREGTASQRSFVEKAIATSDFAFLEGPPGSGKTTAIVELILQLLLDGKRVLLSASTHVAIDNVLERILPFQDRVDIFPIRIANTKNVYNGDIQDFILENILDSRVQKNEAKIILNSANLVCGTTIGILQHPGFREDAYSDTNPVIPEFDYLIIDESSKTTFQEFLVPALRAKKWVLVGDVKQLSPYTEQDYMEKNFSTEIGSKGIANFLIFTLILGKSKYWEKSLEHICVCMNSEVFNSLKNEINERVKRDKVTDFKNSFCFFEKEEKQKKESNYSIIYANEVEKGLIEASLLFGINIIFLDINEYDMLQNLVPSNFEIINLENNPEVLLSSVNKPSYYYRNDDNHENSVSESLAAMNSSWAQEIVWRMTRNFESRFSITNSNKYQKDIDLLMPRFENTKVKDYYNTIYKIALPSILESLQFGVKVDSEKSNRNVLSSGFPKSKFLQRHEDLRYQHRMHPDISVYSRDTFYNSEKLIDSKYMIEDRNWGYKRYQSRNAWINCEYKGSISRNHNPGEVQTLIRELNSFLDWAERNPLPNNVRYTVACLTFYRGQERNIRFQLQKYDKCQNRISSFVVKNVEILLHTVDKFQGREADITYISMVRNDKVGFLDVPNRLNVAMTRARYQRVIIGNYRFFKGLRILELSGLAEKSILEDKL